MGILITTSRRTTRVVNTFTKELAARIPGSIKIQRGKSSWRDLIVRMGSLGCDRLIVVSRWRGNPKFIDMFVLDRGVLKRVMTLSLKSYKLRRPKVDRYKAEALIVNLDPSCGFKAAVVLRDFLASQLRDERSEILEPTTKLLVGYDDDYITMTFFDIASKRYITPTLKLDSFVLHEERYSWHCTKSK